MIIPFSENTKIAASIEQLYHYAQDNEEKLLPTSNFDFWSGYSANSAKFDRYFYQKFRAFKVDKAYDADDSYGEILTDFKALFDVHLFINSKRYSELYRVQVLAADAYDVVNNYDLTEAITRTNTGTVKDNLGARSDSISYGQVQTTHQKGAISESDVYGTHTDSNSSTLGQQTSSSTGSRSAFNSGLTQVEGSGITNGSRSDSSSVTYGAHTDTHTEQAHTDTDSVGSHTDGHSTGAQENTRTDNLTETTNLHRFGNIGVQTPADVIGGHISLWEAFKFYQMIFDDFATDYLLLDLDYDFEVYGSASGGGGGGDAELLAAIRQLSQQLTNATASINTNVDSAETNIRGDISTAQTNIRNDIASSGATVLADNLIIKNKIDSQSGYIRADIAGVNSAVATFGAATLGAIANVNTSVNTFGSAVLGAVADVNTAVITYSAAIRSDIGVASSQQY